MNQRWLSTGFFVFFFTWGVFLPYWTGWLHSDKGMSVAAASVIMGAGMVARSFSTLFLFPFLMSRTSYLHVLRWTTVLSFLLVLLYLPDLSYTSLLIVTVFFSAVYPVILPAVESSASILMQQGGIHYGKSRSYGSIGYTIALLIVGAATAIWSSSAILYLMVIGLFGMMLFFLRGGPEVLAASSGGASKAKGTGFRTLFASRGFIIVMLLGVLLQGAHASYYNFGFIYLEDLQVNGFYIGVILNIAVLFEILFFTTADRLLASMKPSTMFLISAAGSTVRWVLIYLFPVTSVFIGTQVLHAVSFGFAHFAFIQYITKRLPHSQIAAAQGFYAAIAMSLSTAILTFPAGALYDVSPGIAFLGMTVCTVPALLIAFFKRDLIDR